MSVWYMANNETSRQICDRFGISISSAHRTLIRVLNFIWSLKKEYITWPNNRRKLAVSQGFRKKQNINHIIGAIDGSHIRINKPLQHEDVYVNRKQYHSIILQAVVDHEKLFIDVCCGEHGSLHDARVLRRSSLYERAQNNDYFGGYFIIGDSAYPALDWLVTPFRDTGNLTEREKTFNFKLSSTRMIVEHSFGLLKGRFQRLHHVSNLDIETCSKLVMCCCILHNICIIHKDDTNIQVQEENNADDSEPDMDHHPRNCGDHSGVNRRIQVFNEMQ